MHYLLKKFCTLIITLFIVSLLAFCAFQLIGDPTTSMLGTNATPEQVEALRHELGFDRPLLVQYGDWLIHFVQGDMGTSYSYNMPVSEMVGSRVGRHLHPDHDGLCADGGGLHSAGHLCGPAGGRRFRPRDHGL